MIRFWHKNIYKKVLVGICVVLAGYAAIIMDQSLHKKSSPSMSAPIARTPIMNNSIMLYPSTAPVLNSHLAVSNLTNQYPKGFSAQEVGLSRDLRLFQSLEASKEPMINSDQERAPKVLPVVGQVDKPDAPKKYGNNK